MGTELPAERLQRRLGTETEPDADEGRPTGDGHRPDTLLSRWLPDTETEHAPSWITAVRADHGRAGVVALAAVGIIAVLVTVFTVVRDKPPPVMSANLPPVQMVSSGSPTPSGAPAPAQPVVVSVVGLVHKPGLVTLDPGVIVLGGGLSQVDGICDDLTEALARAHIPGLGLPQIRAAQGGDATGARGAALAAVLAMGRND